MVRVSNKLHHQSDSENAQSCLKYVFLKSDSHSTIDGAATQNPLGDSAGKLMDTTDIFL